jgi:hypothetical protein
LSAWQTFSGWLECLVFIEMVVYSAEIFVRTPPAKSNERPCFNLRNVLNDGE